MGKGNKTRFTSSYNLWEHTLPTRFKVDKTELNEPIRRFFNNVIAISYNKGYSLTVLVSKLKEEQSINLSRARLNELAGRGKYAGQPYKGYLYFEWLFAIAKFLGQDFNVMMTNDFTISDSIRDSVSSYWAGKGKGSMAGRVDMSRSTFPEAVNYVVNR